MKQEPKKITKLKLFLLERNINQNELAKNTSLSTNTINHLVNMGKASKSVVKLVSLDLGITVNHLNQLMGFLDSQNILDEVIEAPPEEQQDDIVDFVEVKPKKTRKKKPVKYKTNKNEKTTKKPLKKLAPKKQSAKN